MTITLQKLQQAATSLSNLAQVTTLPIKKKYWLGRFIEQAETELKRVEKQRVELVKKYGEGDEEKGYRLKPENVSAFAKDYEELLSVEVEFDFELRFTIEELDSDKLNAADFANLGWLIAEPDAENT